MIPTKNKIDDVDQFVPIRAPHNGSDLPGDMAVDIRSTRIASGPAGANAKIFAANASTPFRALAKYARTHRFLKA